MRARYVQQVEPGHVGQRVSVRHLVHDHERGAVPSDVVGRLGALDTEALLIIDRHGQLHSIDAQAVLSSRVIPPHPRREPEPAVGTQDAPLYRAAARALVLDPDDRVLLVAHRTQPSQPSVWTAPGGGIEPHETATEAARRELGEELNIAATIGQCVWKRRVTFSYRGLWLDQDEQWFLVRADSIALAEVPLGDADTVDASFFSLEQLGATDVSVAPAALALHLETLLRDGPPNEPVDVGR